VQASRISARGGQHRARLRRRPGDFAPSGPSDNEVVKNCQTPEWRAGMRTRSMNRSRFTEARIGSIRATSRASCAGARPPPASPATSPGIPCGAASSPTPRRRRSPIENIKRVTGQRSSRIVLDYVTAASLDDDLPLARGAPHRRRRNGVDVDVSSDHGFRASRSTGVSILKSGQCAAGRRCLTSKTVSGDTNGGSTPYRM
jgi:hypothetical protein